MAEVKIETGGDQILAVTFAANGEYLVSGDEDKIRVWQPEGGRELRAMKTTAVNCLAVSGDGSWIAAGTWSRGLFVWNTETHKKVWEHSWGDYVIYGVDFSPDSTRLVVALGDCTATIFNVATWKHALDPLHHELWVNAAKYSPNGDRIATATRESIRVWDSGNGCWLSDVKVGVTPQYNTGLLWLDSHIFIVSENRLKRIDASTGLVVSEWQIPDSNDYSCIVLPQRGEFIAYSTTCSVSFWHTSTNAQFGLIQHPTDIRSVAFSPDGRSIVIGGEDGKIIIKNLSAIYDSMTLCRLHPEFQVPDIQTTCAALDSWQHDQLANADAMLTTAVHVSQIPSSLLASRALVRTRLRQWDNAVVDAEESINICPSVLGYVAKGIALAGKGEKRKAYRSCDIAFDYLRSTPITFLLLIKAVIVFIAGEHDDAISRLDDIIAIGRVKSVGYLIQAYMHFLVGESYMENGDFNDAIRSFEHARAQIGNNVEHSHLLDVISLVSGWKFDHLRVTIRQRLCEALYAAGRMKHGMDALLDLVKIIEAQKNVSRPITKWVSDFTESCLSTPDSTQIRSAALSMANPSPLLRLWAKTTLVQHSWNVALAVALKFMVPRFAVYRALCEHLENFDRVIEAVECLQEMGSKLLEDIDDQQVKWTRDFGKHCATRLTLFGDIAMHDQRHDDAIYQYSSALSLSLASPQLYIKRSEAYAKMGLWTDALNDANKAIHHDASSPWGYEGKYVALRGAGHYSDMFDAFETMLLRMSRSPDPFVRVRHDLHIKTAEAIRKAIQDAIHESPRVLINTITGRLCDKSEQAAAFESSPMFTDLILSMTAQIDHTRIDRQVQDYYRYATFSHRWEPNEPLYEKVVHIVVYELGESLTHDKLLMFCKVVRDAGFNWAWSDTCCINKADHFILQEALVAMFKWYEGSSLTVIFLRGVFSPSQRGELLRSDWNTRVWTFQEYHASKVVRFYTEDWKPYLNLNIHNHKESPDIVSEMEEATGISSRGLMSLRPGLDDVRGKLRLASQRKTTLIEDAAYSLLGIFSITMPVVYGEGDKAIGRLLAQLLSSSGDTSILAWNGKSGSFNSCLPCKITVFQEFPPTHIPNTVDNAEMDMILAGLQSSSLNPTLVRKLHDRLLDLPVPLFADKRVRLPCLTFKLGPLSGSRIGSEWVFRAQTSALGVVEIKSSEDLSRLDSLHLVHPWIDFLLDRQPIGTAMDMVPDDAEDASGGSSPSSTVDLPSSPGLSIITPVSTLTPSRALRFAARLGLPFSTSGRSQVLEPLPDAASLRPPSSISEAEQQVRAFRALARLKRPFGALLLAANHGGVAAYKRVAAESLITVQVVEEITSTIMNKLIDGVRILDVL